MTNTVLLSLIIPTYNRSVALLGLLDYLSEHSKYLEGTAIYINSSTDDGSSQAVIERIADYGKRVQLTYTETPKTTLSAAIRESLLKAPGVYKAVIADDFKLYAENIPAVISELNKFRPLFYRTYFVGYHTHSQKSCEPYNKPEAIIFAGQHFGYIYSDEAIRTLVENDALCFRLSHEESKECVWVHQMHWSTAIISELLFLSYEKQPKQFISSGIPFAAFTDDNLPSIQAKVTTYPYWHAGYFSEETWSVVTFYDRLANKYKSSFNEAMLIRLANVYIFDSVLKTLDFYSRSGIYKKRSLFDRIKKLLNIRKYI